MISSSNTVRLSGHRIGELARDFLKPGSHGRIIAVFSNAIYLYSVYDELLWLVTEKIPMHRRGIQIPGALPRVEANSSFSVRGQHLLLGSDIDLDMSVASLWESPRPNLDKVIPLEELPKRLRDVSSLFGGYTSPKGFGWILSEVAMGRLGSTLPTESPKHGPLEQRTWSAFNEMVLASIVNDFPRILGISNDLIGLGEGLTPSGDDFIGGLLFASFVLQEIYSQYQGFTQLYVELFIISSRNKTNLISYIMLKDLAAGHAFDTLHHFVTAILTDKQLENTDFIGRELIRIGHSTGWDLLTGVWTGMLLSTYSRAALSCSVPAITSRRH